MSESLCLDEKIWFKGIDLKITSKINDLKSIIIKWIVY